MTISDQHTQVLIVGAGPSGLMMAAQLLRYGIQPIIIDSKQGPTDESKALGVQARSMEIYRQMGLVDTIIKDGKKAKDEEILAYDVGPGNAMIDDWVLHHTGQAYDEYGLLAASGNPDMEIVECVLAKSFFRPSPHSSKDVISA